MQDMPIAAWGIFVAAALLEVIGDWTIRRGLGTRGYALIALGFVMLCCYGLVVNTVKWNFSRLLGVYVAIFAVTSVAWGRFIDGDKVPMGMWVGVAIIVVGGLLVQSAAPSSR